MEIDAYGSTGWGCSANPSGAFTFTILCPGGDISSIPAVLEKNNPGYESRILPIAESLVYPAYWLGLMKSWPANSSGDAVEMLQKNLQGSLVAAVRRHTLRLLTDPAGCNLFADGGLKLSSTSNNSWMSKIAIFQFVARAILRMEDADPRIADIMKNADAAHTRWQTDGSGYWACSDQFVSGEAKGSRYYPRIITAALWLEELEKPWFTPERPAKLKSIAVDRPVTS